MDNNLQQPQEAENPFDAPDMVAAEAPSLLDRARLNMTDAFYRGTIVGSAGMFARKKLADDFSVDPAAREKAQKDYESILNDLGRYDALKDFSGPLEMSAAFSGQMLGGSLSPEAWISKVPGAGRLFGPLIEKTVGRFGEQAVSQAAVQGATDPAVQALSIGAGTQDEYSPMRTAASVGLGAAIGGVLHIPSELGRKAAPEVMGITPDQTPVNPLKTETTPVDPVAEVVKETDKAGAVSAEDVVGTEVLGAPSTFKTAKGSTYEIHSDGTTTRNKAARPDVGHEGDSGLKERSAKTIYVDNQKDASALSSAGISSGGGKGWHVVLRDGKATLISWNKQKGAWGASPESRNIPFSKTPEVGKHPVELWGPNPVDGLGGEIGYSGQHAGNAIVEMSSVPSGKVAPENFSVTVAEPQDLRSFVRDAGGLKDWKGELKAADFNKRFPGLVSKNGVELDKMREAATEAGYLPEGSTPDDLVQALLSNDPVYSAEDHAQALEYKAQLQAKDYADTIRSNKAELAALEPNPYYPEIHDEAARIMAEDRNLSPEDAIAQASESFKPDAPAAPKYEPMSTDGLQFKKRTATGESIPRNPVGQVAAAAGESPNSAQLLSLQDQGARLAEEIGHPLRQGRVQGGQSAEGQFDTRQGVVRVRNVADFETIAHEAGHYIDAKLGDAFKKLRDKFDLELSYMDYDQTRMDPSEGFAEFARQYITAPQAAERAAPGFTKAFESYLGEVAPTMLESLRSARDAYAAWEAAPSGARLDAMVKTEKPEGIFDGLRKDGFRATVGNVVNRVYEALFDDKAAVTRAVRDLARMARDASGTKLNLEGTGNPEALARLFSRAHQAAQRSMMDGVRPYHQIVPEGPSLTDALVKATGGPNMMADFDAPKMKEFSNYLVAKRVSYLWDKKNAGLLENRPAAMTKGDADLAIAEAEKANPQFAEAAQMVHDYTRQLLRKMFDGGLIDRELYKKLQAEGFYVPLFRDMSDKPLTSGAGSAGGAKTEGPGVTQLVKRMRGSDRDIIDPVQSIMTQTFLVERTLAHNDMIKSMVDLARAAQKAGAVDTGRILEEIPPQQIVGKKFDLVENMKAAAKQNGIDETDTKVLLSALSDTFGEDPIIGTMFHQEPTGKRGEPVVFYKDGGKLRAVRLISGKEGMALYEALTSLPSGIRDWALTLGSASATALRAGVTTSPEFALANFVRDQLATAVLRSDYIPFWDGLRGVGKELKQGETAQLYTAAGGMAPGSGAAGMSELINGDINQLARKGWLVQRLGDIADLRKGNILSPFKALADTIGVAESGTRLAVFDKVFKQKVAQGLPEYDAMLEAAFQSTDLMDFSRHGSGTEFIRKLVPFLNANLVGLDKARRTIITPLYRAAIGDVVTKQEANDVKNASLALFKLAGVGGALGYAYGLWAQQHQSYKDASDRLRATHVVLPGAAFGKPDKVIVAPKPFELAVGFNLGEALAAATTGDPRAAQFARDAAYEVLMPPNVLESIPVLKTWAETKLNRSFFTGRNIVPEEMQKLPVEQQASPNTSYLAKLIGPKIGVSPIMVDYVVGQQFGSWGRNVLSMSKSFDPDAPPQAMEDSVFSRRFIKSAFNGSEMDRKYWELAGKTNGEYVKAKNGYENLLRSYKDADAMRFLAGLPEGQRAYVQLNSDVGDDGKFLHSSDARSLHPITRAAKAIDLLNGYARDLTGNIQNSIATGEKVPMSPDKRRAALDAINTLKAMEQQNALILTKEPGYSDRRLQDTEGQFSILKSIAPDVADEIATRYASSKIYPTATVARVWPKMSKELLTQGHEADLSEFVSDAKSDEYAFGGEKVKKAGKRRVPMTLQTAP